MNSATRMLCAAVFIATALRSGETPLEFDVQLDVIRDDGFDKKTSWFHPRPGVIPGEPPTVVVTLQKMLSASGATSDVFLPVSSQYTTDLGKAWSPAVQHDTLGRRRDDDGMDTAVCDFTPKWHAKSGKLICTGHTVRYSGNALVKRLEKGLLIPNYAKQPSWSVYDPRTKGWSAWNTVAMPDRPEFWSVGAGSAQRVDLENGDILIPLNHRAKDAIINAITVMRCRFDGEKLTHVEHGSAVKVEVDRGLIEPSLTRHRGRFFLTMRNDKASYVAAGDDGLNFGAPRKWTFDDGSDLGSYNTQTHWVTHSDGLFLVYTRRGADNDMVLRHRAPLFMAQIDPERLVVLRATERALVPNKGADLGNFGACNVGPHETWVTTAEGMRPKSKAVEMGANDRVYAARIKWKKENKHWAQ